MQFISNRFGVEIMFRGGLGPSYFEQVFSMAGILWTSVLSALCFQFFDRILSFWPWGRLAKLCCAKVKVPSPPLERLASPTPNSEFTCFKFCSKLIFDSLCFSVPDSFLGFGKICCYFASPLGRSKQSFMLSETSHKQDDKLNLSKVPENL